IVRTPVLSARGRVARASAGLPSYSRTRTRQQRCWRELQAPGVIRESMTSPPPPRVCAGHIAREVSLAIGRVVHHRRRRAGRLDRDLAARVVGDRLDVNINVLAGLQGPAHLRAEVRLTQADLRVRGVIYLHRPCHRTLTIGIADRELRRGNAYTRSHDLR